MRLTLTRDVFGPTATLGTLTVDGKSFGFTVEDEDRGLSQGMTDAEVREKKVKAETAIPVGRYRVATTFSQRFQRDLPLVQDVPGFRGIRIHPGNSEAHTEGCVLPGLARDVERMRVERSTAACDWLNKQIRQCEERGEPVWLEVGRDEAAWARWSK